MKLHLIYGWGPTPMSVQSSRKQKERSCTVLQHGPCEWGMRIQSSVHGSAARAVQERSGSTRVSCTDRVRKIGLARVFNTGHVRETCNFHLPHTGRAAQHGPCCSFGLHGSRLVLQGACSRFLFLHGSSLVLHGSCNFHSSEVGNLIFSQYSGFIMIWDF